MTLEHLGIAVQDADAAVALFSALLGAEPYKVEVVEREGVRTVFFGDDGAAGRAPKLELLDALGPDSPVAKFLDKRGPGLHHVAFEVESVEAELARLRAAGFEPLSDVPKPGADGKRIAFLHPKTTGGVLVELCETVIGEERVDVPFEGGVLVAFVSGPEEAPPLVVLHAALGATELETRRLTRRWARHFRVYALDFMAHGQSDAFAGRPLVMEDFAGNVIALLDAAGLESAHLYGFSMGGSVALYAAWRHPERFRRLALHGVNVQWDDREATAMTGAMRSALAEPDGFWAQRLAHTHGEDRWRDLAERLIEFTDALPGRRFPDEGLQQIPHPTLVVHGDRDRFFDLRHAVHLLRTLPDARLAVLPGVDHPLQTADAAEVSTLVERHLLAA